MSAIRSSVAASVVQYVSTEVTGQVMKLDDSFHAWFVVTSNAQGLAGIFPFGFIAPPRSDHLCIESRFYGADMEVLAGNADVEIVSNLIEF